MKRFRKTGAAHGKFDGTRETSAPHMGELVFIGLGLHDEKGISLRGLEEARTCDELFAEFYTSTLPGASLATLERTVGRRIRVLSRDEVERGEAILDASRIRRVGLLVVGDPMTATTHVDLRLRARAAGIPTRVIHGASILTAASGALGLQASKFGRTTTVPTPAPGFEPASPFEVILANFRAGLHTLVLLDLAEGGVPLSPQAALRQILSFAERAHAEELGLDTLACVVSRAGAPEVRSSAGRIRDLLDRDLGPPLHAIVIPGDLHFLEREALTAFAGARADL